MFNLTEIIRQIPLFSFLSEKKINTLISLSQLIYLEKNNVLYEENMDVHDVCIVLTGRLFVYQNRVKNEPIKIISYINKHELIGETSILCQDKLPATIAAARDSSLLKIPQAVFDQLLLREPEIHFQLSRHLAKSLNDTIKHHAGNLHERRIQTISIFPAGNEDVHRYFVKQFVKELSKQKKVLVLTEKEINQHFNIKEQGGFFNYSLLNYVNDLESHYDCIILTPLKSNEALTRFFLNQSDLIYLVGEFNQSSDLSSIERFIFDQSKTSVYHTPIYLILLHEAVQYFYSNTNRWLKKRPINGHYHIGTYHIPDYQKLVRFLLGRSIGLAFSGGGVLASAHLGLIKVLKEWNIPVDTIIGVSGGAIVGSLLAMGYDSEEALSLLKAQKKPKLTFPFYSIYKGSDFDAFFLSIFEEKKLEDLHQCYSCVAYNLSTNHLVVPERGLLWQWVRASSATPGLIPPVIINKSLYVDGGIANNLPVDVLQNLNAGVIIASNVSINSTPKCYGNKELHPLKDFINQIMLKKEDAYFPSIIENIILCLTISRKEYQQINNEQIIKIDYPIEQYSILDSSCADIVFQIGYEYGKKVLSKRVNSKGIRKGYYCQK